jgi:hypothetical protein
MGDRAIVIFHSPKDHSVSPAVYLHSHAGLLLNLLEGALPRMRTGDAGYSCARFIGICHDEIPGNASLGVYNVPGTAADAAERHKPAEYDRLMAAARRIDYGDRGVFLVDVDRWRVEHAGTAMCAYGDMGDGFGRQEGTTLNSPHGVVQLPAAKAGT